VGGIGGLAQPPAAPELTVSRRSVFKPLSDVVEDPEIFDRFVVACTRAISPYYTDADIKLRSLSIDQAHPLMRRVEQRRMRRANQLLASYQMRGVPPYCPIALANGPSRDVWLIWPPLVEPHAKRAYVINGHHRLRAAREAGVRRAQVITIEDVRARAPAAASRWRDVNEAKRRTLSDEGATTDLRDDLIRPSASFCRSRYFSFRSLEKLVDWCEWLANCPDRYLWNPETQMLDVVGQRPATGSDQAIV
jgi:hypothetical protein